MNFLRRRPASLQLLVERDFRNYFIADAMFDFAAQLRQVVMGWAALMLTNSQFWVGLVIGIPGLTMVMFAPLAGVAVDRYDRRNTLVWVRLSFVASALPLGILAALDMLELWHLVAASLAVGAARAFSFPALRAFITDLVGRERVLTANALTGSSSSAGELAGPVVAGILIASLGIGSIFMGVALVFGVCGLLILRVRSIPMRERSDEALVSQIRQGISYVARTPPLPALLVITLTQLPAAAAIPLLPTYAENVLNIGASGYGIMSGALGAGFLFGSLATTTILDFPKKGLALILTALLWDISSIVFGFSRSYPLSLVMLFLMGVGGAVHVIFLLTLFQTVAQARMLGRVMSMYGVLTASFPLGLILGGALASAFGNEQAIIIGALGSTPVVLLAYALSPELRRR
ncbi:MAG: MFS transporter [Dehalococcoidia bacterium]|nr:MFS transporter [Dehalococcoidia bacterium]